MSDKDNFIEFVITIPDEESAKIAYENKARQTHGVLIDIVLAAENFIILSSPYLKDLKTVNPTLNGALLSALKKGIKLHILSTDKSFDLANLSQYNSSGIFLYKPNTTRGERLINSHAKFFMSDGKQVYLGSANFTIAGLNHNIEMGVYAIGNLAKQVESFWEYLLENRYIVSQKL